MRSPLWDPVLRGRAALPHMARRLCSRVPTIVYTSGMRTFVCVRALACTHVSLQVSQCARISEGTIFETSSRRARDLQLVVVVSIITAVIGSKFIGISIKVTRMLVRIFFEQQRFKSKRFSFLERVRIGLSWDKQEESSAKCCLKIYVKSHPNVWRYHNNIHVLKSIA